MIDASVAIAWLLEDEDTPDIVSSLGTAEDVETFVPQLWHFETRNSLLMAERRGRIDRSQIAQRFRYLSNLSVQTDTEPNFDSAMQLARTHRLTFYDALYLELALRRNAQLATLDRSLASAASTEGVQMPV